MQERKSYLIGKAFNQFLWASVLTVAATQVANIVDATIVGHLIGPEALAAVNLSKPLLQTFFAISCLYVPAATILTGTAIGKGDTQRGGRLMTFSVLLSIGIGMACIAGGWAFFGPLSHLLCPSKELYPLATQFMSITILSSVAQLVMYTVHQFVTVDGSPRLVMVSVITGNVFNILLDIVFIKFCGMGIAGAAWATCAMYIVCILTSLPHFRKAHTLRLLRPRMRSLKLGQLFSIGLPLFFSTVLISVQYLGANRIASHYLGNDGLVALAVCMQLFALSMIILTGTLRTIQPVGSILAGMDDSRGMLMLMKRAYRFLALCLLAYAAAIIFFPSQIGEILGVTQGPAMEAVKTALPLFSLHIVMQALLFNLMPLFQFYERKDLALFLSIAQTLLPVVFFYLMHGQWIGFFIGQLITGIVIVVWGSILRRSNPTLCPFFLIPMKGATEKFEVTVAPHISSLTDAISQLSQFLSRASLPQRSIFHACLCTEEFLKNIIEHGEAHAVDLGATVVDGHINITLHDDGRAFNPIAFAHDTPEKIGLGLKIAQGISHKLDYKYIFHQNMLTMQI